MLNAIPASPRPQLSDTATNVDVVRRLAPGMLVAGRYRILAQLGLGGMGVVYRALDQELGMDIALKVLRTDVEDDPERLERLRRELVLAREVSHRNVVRIHDIGDSDGLRFLTMRLVEGRSLLEVLEKEGPLSLDRALRVLRQLAEALQQAHEAGIVHRDLKPGNVLLAPDDTAYVTDFGIACSRDRDGLTRPGVVVGTFDYLSPEQLTGDHVDGRSDIYALGILLFEILTGQLPFRGDSRAEAIARRLTGRPREIGDTGVQVPAYVRAMIRRCLERMPSRRYASLRELIADLDARRARPLVRIPRGPLVVLLAVAVGTAAGLVFHRQTSRHAGVPVPAPAPSAPAVAVLPLRDETGDPSLAWTASGVAEMLAAHLGESPRLRVLDTARVLRTLKDLKLGGDADEAALRRLAALLEVDHIVSGSIRRAGRTVDVDLRLVSPGGTGPLAPWATRAQAPDAGGLFRLVGELGQRLRGRLGTAGAPGLPAPAPPTASLEAAQAYREGRERLAIGDAVAAAAAFERAVQADAGFAAALLGLGEAHQALGYDDEALAAVERAGAALGPADTRLSWRVRARLALLHGDPAEAEKAYAELVRRYPNETETLIDLAAAQASQGAVANAVTTLKRVSELDKGDPRAWFLLGKNMILAGDARQALTDPLVHALALMTQLGNRQGQGDVLNAMGVAHQRLGEYPQAAARYGEAAALRNEVRDERGAAVSLKNRASVHLATGRFAEAEPDLRAARAVYEKINDQKDLADVWNDFGALYEGRGEYTEARKAYQAALRIRRELGDEQQLAQSYDNVGYVFFMEGERDNAQAYWKQALDLRQRIGDKGGIVLSTQNMGFLQMARGAWGEAMRSFLDALEKSRAIDFTNALAVSQGYIGLLHQYEGRYGAALSAYAEAIRILEGLDDRRGLAEFTIRQATVLIELRRLDAAKAKLDSASAWVGATGNREQAADLQVALGEWHLARNEADASRQAFARALDLARASRSPAAALRARIARGTAAVTLGAAAAAQPDLASAVGEADHVGDALLRVRAAEALARAELALGRADKAEDAARRALRGAERCGWEAGLHGLHALRGRIREARGDPAGAAAAYRESARRIAGLRAGLAPELRASFDGLPVVRAVEAWLETHTTQATP